MNCLRRMLPLCSLLLALTPGWVGTSEAQTTEIRPVDFLLTGSVLEEGSGTPLDRARIIIERQDDGTVLADRVFTDGSGLYSVVFEAEVEVTVGLGDDGIDPDQPRESSFGGRWMGKMWPNPVVGDGNARLTLPYASPEKSTAQPELQLFDMRGRRISEDETLAAGVYFYRLRFGDRFVPARKLVVMQPTRPRVDLVPMKATSTASDEAPDGLAKRVDGQVNVVVRVLRLGYVPEAIPWTVESQQENTVDASLAVEPAPTAALQVGGTLEAGQAVTFDGSTSVAADGQPLDFSWDFGDDQLGGAQQVSHVYAAAGTYDVVLTVTGTHGATDSTPTQITVAAPPPPVTSDAQIVGSITDVAGNLLDGVVGTIVGTSVVDTSLTDGSLTLDGAPTGVPLSIQLSKDGYAEQIVRIALPDSTEFTSFESTLAPRRSAVTIARIEDGELCRGEDGAVVDLPPDALLRPDGSPATGEARLSITPLDMSNERESFAFPGGYEGVQPTGERGLILSYGVMEVVFEQEGEELQLAPGRSAGVEIPLYSSNATVGDVIALWSVDPNTGLWRQEGEGTVVANGDSPTGLALAAEVAHFSWWNADKFDEEPYRPIPRCKIKDQNGLPTLDIPSGGACYINGRLQSGNGPWGNPDTSIPPAGGRVLPVPANEDFLLTASASNGTQRGTIVVNGPSGVTEEVIIPLDPVGGGGGTLVFPAEETATIDPAGEIDLYTFEVAAGQSFNLGVQTVDGSSLWGIARLRDPSGAAVDSATFRPDSPAGLAREAEVGGIWTLEVDGTDNEPGAYEILARFVSIIDVNLPSVLEIDTRPGWVQPLRLEAEAGTWMSLDCRRLSGTGASGSVRILAPDGTEIEGFGFSFSFTHLGLVQLPQTGTYTIEHFSRDLAGNSVLSLRDVPDMDFGQTVLGSLEEESVQYYRTPALTGDAANVAIEKLGNFAGGVSFVDAQQQSAFTQIQIGGNVSTGVRYPQDEGPWFVKVTSSFRTDDRSLREYRVRLDDVRPPAPLVFDQTGRSTNALSIERFGQLRLLRFEGTAGDGLWIQLLETANPSPGTDLTLGLYHVGSGELLDPEDTQSDQYRVSGQGGVEVLEAVSFKLDEGGTHVLAVGSTSLSTGEFELRVDRVAASSSITVDDDLTECPNADTRSLEAALAAADAGGTVSLCEGDYVSPEGYQRTGGAFGGGGPITLEGAGRELTRISADSRYSNQAVITFSDGLVAMRDLSIETRGLGANSGVYVFSGNGTLFERVDFRAVDGTAIMKAAIDVSSNDDMVVRDCLFERVDRAIEATNCERPLVENSLFDQERARLDLENCNEAIIRGNVFNATDLGLVISLTNSAGGQVTDNDVTITTGDIGANLNTAAFQIDDDDEAGNLPDTVVRDNRIVTNEAGFRVSVRRGSSGVVVENNVLQMTDSRGRTAMEIFGNRLDPDVTAIVRNNVFEGVALFEGFRIAVAERLTDVQFVNNSARVAPGSNTGSNYEFIEVTVNDSGFSGPLPITLANNVFQGVDSGIGVSLPDGVSLDSDWNLFDGFPTLYTGGGTSTGTNDLVDVDPLFADDELRLQAASPAVDSGASQAEVSSVPDADIEGTARPQGTGVDRGAYER